MTVNVARSAALLAMILALVALSQTHVSPAGAASARYVMHATSDPLAPEGEQAKVAISMTAAVAGRRYFLRLKRTSSVRQPPTGAECRDTAATVLGVTAGAGGKVTFAPQPGGPYSLGAAHLCKGTYNGSVLEQRAGRGTRVVRKFTLSYPTLALTTVRI